MSLAIAMILAFLLIVTAVTAFIVTKLNNEINDLSEKLSANRDGLAKVKAEVADLEIGVTEARNCSIEAHGYSRQAVSTADNCEKIVRKYANQTYGTTDPDEYSRFRTTIMDDHKKILELEKMLPKPMIEYTDSYRGLNGYHMPKEESNDSDQ